MHESTTPSAESAWDLVCEFDVDEWFTCNLARVFVMESTSSPDTYRVFMRSTCMSVQEQVFTGSGASDLALEAAIRIVGQIQALNDVCVQESP